MGLGDVVEHQLPTFEVCGSKPGSYAGKLVHVVVFLCMTAYSIESLTTFMDLFFLPSKLPSVLKAT